LYVFLISAVQGRRRLQIPTGVSRKKKSLSYRFPTRNANALGKMITVLSMQERKGDEAFRAFGVLWLCAARHGVASRDWLSSSSGVSAK
jgi:hypothetical protein